MNPLAKDIAGVLGACALVCAAILGALWILQPEAAPSVAAATSNIIETNMESYFVVTNKAGLSIYAVSPTWRMVNPTNFSSDDDDVLVVVTNVGGTGTTLRGFRDGDVMPWQIKGSELFHINARERTPGESLRY